MRRLAQMDTWTTGQLISNIVYIILSNFLYTYKNNCPSVHLSTQQKIATYAWKHKWRCIENGVLYLQYVQDLLFDLFEDVLHLYHDDLHLALVALAAKGVDFAAHLLGYKA